MCIAKLDYEVSIVGYKDFSTANILTSLSIKSFLRSIDSKTHPLRVIVRHDAL